MRRKAFSKVVPETHLPQTPVIFVSCVYHTSPLHLTFTGQGSNQYLPDENFSLTSASKSVTDTVFVQTQLSATPLVS